jgi:hypothetical protein
VEKGEERALSTMKGRETRSRWRNEEPVFENFMKSEFSSNFPNSLHHYKQVQKPSSESSFFLADLSLMPEYHVIISPK